MTATSQESTRPKGNRWITGRLSVGETRVRLICLAQAGAGAGAFSGWRRHVPDGYELAPVELPGRGTRESEPMPESFEALVDALFAGLSQELTVPYVLFGHSFGGFLAYELSRRIEAGGELPPPVATLVSGSRAPHIPPQRKMWERDDRELINWLTDNGGLPLELLRYTDFVQHVIRAIRADLRLAENYLVPQPVALRRPLHVFGGAKDQVAPPEGLSHWRQCAADEFSATILPGGHAFPHKDPEAMMAAVLGVLPL